MVSLAVGIIARKAVEGGKQAVRAFRGVRDAAKEMDDKVTKAGGASQAAGSKIKSLAISAAAAIGVFKSVNILANFESTMAELAAVTGSTADQFASLESTAREMGATTRFSAIEAAERSKKRRKDRKKRRRGQLPNDRHALGNSR